MPEHSEQIPVESKKTSVFSEHGSYRSSKTDHVGITTQKNKTELQNPPHASWEKEPSHIYFLISKLRWSSSELITQLLRAS